MTEDETALPHLTASAITSLAETWGDGGLWADVERLAVRFHRAPADDCNGYLERTVAWHHLVMAVGNFKRQRGYRLRATAPLTALQQADSEAAPMSFTAPLPTPTRVERDDLASWQNLRHHLDGAGGATTTTLLAALWPGHHFVYDWRVHHTANGLRFAGGLAPTDDIDADAVGPAGAATLARYAVVRRWLQATATECEQPLVSVERALYRLSQQVNFTPGWNWRNYGDALVEHLASI